MIAVKTLSYLDIYKEFPALVVPDYQRAYTWDTNKIEDLINDWEEFIKNKNFNDLTYYMGTLLFYFNTEEKQFEIIDGQQRLTSLALIYYQMFGALLQEQNLSYNQYSSAHNIFKNHKYLSNRQQIIENLKNSEILKKIQFTIIISDSEDNAFTFFDSQNNRGVTLGVDDYLKAYHLRAIPESNQEKMAKEWEAITFFASKNIRRDLNLDYLFEDILFKARQWKGQKVFPYQNKDNVLKEFQKKTLKAEKDKQNYRLFANKNNMRFQTLEYQEDNSLSMLSREKIVDQNHFPFSLRQPLFEGHNFFLFTQKYHGIYKLLFFKTHEKGSILYEVVKFYKSIYTNDMSRYLNEYMQLCMVIYYDNFGEEKIIEAVKHFDFFIGSMRIDKYYVRTEAVKNSLKNAENNLLDIIQGSYLPNEVFEFIKEQKEVVSIYQVKKNYVNQEGIFKNSVIERYIDRVCEYHNQEKMNFENRKLWLA